ncbi:uncharacterized protein LOC108668349 [Hyalella azteca]|uniref:Uncharacterized protein LOC108668349 n=1 Tax=Hyalella azteca TaxID=294128 RepID=A0A8B7NBP7_HYAAZ|nr:uncharacterized protein LOC108668349 [Hyalella azteca]
MENARPSIAYPEWSKDHSRLFIRLYEKHPCLWKLKSDAYKDRGAKSQAYKDIIENMKHVVPGISVPIIKRKINTLRGQFRREVRLMLASRETAMLPEQMYQPKLWCYNHLLFLGEDDDEYRDPANLLRINCYDEDVDLNFDTKDGITDQLGPSWAGLASSYHSINHLDLPAAVNSTTSSPNPSASTSSPLQPAMDSGTDPAMVENSRESASKKLHRRENSSDISRDCKYEENLLNFIPNKYPAEDSSENFPRNYHREESSSDNIFKKQRAENASDTVKMALSALSAVSGCGRPIDECDDFGKVVGNKLRRMTEEQREVTEKIIMEALFLGSRGLLTAGAHVILDEGNGNNGETYRPASSVNNLYKY